MANAAIAAAGRGGFPAYGDPLFVGRPKSIKALEAAMEAGKSIVLVAQKSAAKDEPAPEDMYEIGTRGQYPANAETARRHGESAGRGRQRARINRYRMLKTHFTVEATPVEADNDDQPPKSRRCAARWSRSSIST